MNKDINFETYQSPFTWRYGSDEMRSIFSEINKRKTWRRVWVALARAQAKAGLLTKQELSDIEKNSGKINIKRSLEIEKEIYHDVMAEIKTFAESAKVGGGKIHLGATSTDIDDNAEIVRIKEALGIIE
ncbi:MAG TPA: adenylosuccinate lyase, partial [Candidatus Paceibacterota bacterium]